MEDAGLNVLEVLQTSPKTSAELCKELNVSRQRVDQIVKMLMKLEKIKREKLYKSNYIYYIPDVHKIEGLPDKIINI